MSQHAATISRKRLFITAGLIASLLTLSSCMQAPSQSESSVSDVGPSDSANESTLDAEANVASLFLSSLEGCGLTFTNDLANGDPVSYFRDMDAGKVAIIDGRYLALDISTSWDLQGISQISLACMFAELGIVDSFASAISAEAEKQENNSQLVATGSAGFAANSDELAAKLEGYVSEAAANSAWNSDRNNFLGVLQSTYARECSDPEKWPGDSYLCGNQRDFTIWISNIGCVTEDYSLKNYCGGTAGQSSTWVLPLRPTFENEIETLRSSIQEAEGAESNAQVLESGDGLLFTQLNGELSQAWAFGKSGNLFIVFKSQDE
tara:strand:- start:2311 stop:3273 length:963 start_codon:yes stop_codon:yes gene_type:complete